MFSIEGRSLIRIFLAGATKDAALYGASSEEKVESGFGSFKKNDYL